MRFVHPSHLKVRSMTFSQETMGLARPGVKWVSCIKVNEAMLAYTTTKLEGPYAKPSEVKRKAPIDITVV